MFLNEVSNENREGRVIVIADELWTARGLSVVDGGSSKGVDDICEFQMGGGCRHLAACKLLVVCQGLLSEFRLKSIQEHRQKYTQLLNDRINNLSDLATKFVLSCEGVSSALVGIDKLEYLEKALMMADGNYLDIDMLEKAKRLAYPDPEFLNLPVWERKRWLT